MAVASDGAHGAAVSGDVFFKMSGSGNDFVFLDGRWTTPGDWPADRIRQLCARGTGVGADGVVVLAPGSGPGSVRFIYFNADGNRAEMCGNAALCATRLAVYLEMAPPGAVTLETDAGVVQARCVPGSEGQAELLLPDVASVTCPAIPPADGEEEIGFALVGVPHLVVAVRDLEAVDLLGRGRALRHHPTLAPAGANVNFVAPSDGGWSMRTYERGVEDETLACGTGAVACATVLSAGGRATLPFSVRTRSGSLLRVSGTSSHDIALQAPRLEGEGRLVFRGMLGPGY
jgi:diaminopimelate epimerase